MVLRFSKSVVLRRKVSSSDVKVSSSEVKVSGSEVKVSGSDIFRVSCSE